MFGLCVLQTPITVKPGASIHANLIQSPSRRTRIVDRRAPQISRILPFVRTPGGAVHHGRIIPDDQVAWLFPFHAHGVLGSGSPLHEGLAELVALIVRQTLDVMHMLPNIQVHSATGFVELGNAVEVHFMVQRIQVFEEFRGTAFTAVM